MSQPIYVHYRCLGKNKIDLVWLQFHVTPRLKAHAVHHLATSSMSRSQGVSPESSGSSGGLSANDGFVIGTVVPSTKQEIAGNNGPTELDHQDWQVTKASFNKQVPSCSSLPFFFQFCGLPWQGHWFSELYRDMILLLGFWLWHWCQPILYLSYCPLNTRRFFFPHRDFSFEFAFQQSHSLGHYQ